MREKTRDPQDMTAYSKEVPAGHSAKFLAAYGNEDLEGSYGRQL
jgi:hypothetical protein